MVWTDRTRPDKRSPSYWDSKCSNGSLVACGQVNSYNRLRILVPPGAWLTEFRSVLTRRVCACGLRLEPERECHVQLTAAPGGSKRQRFVVVRRAQP